MRVLVTGVKGQLGHDVMDELAAKGIEGIGVDVEEMDITDAAACEKVITEAKPDAVIHCAAYTAVDAAEDNVELCLVDISKMQFTFERFLIAAVFTWLLMALMIVVGIWYPAYKAMRLQPAEALHDE